jgi:hypothetical protein
MGSDPGFLVFLVTLLYALYWTIVAVTSGILGVMKFVAHEALISFLLLRHLKPESRNLLICLSMERFREAKGPHPSLSTSILYLANPIR